jgi:adenosylcobinamide-GDP ribazoletransferase
MKGWGLASAFRTLTILPFPGKECESPATAMYWFVPVGMFLGGISYAIAWFSYQWNLHLLGGAVVVLMMAAMTRAFHLDGLADMADGFGGGWTRERILEIMKDSHMGAFGVIALVVVLLVKFAALATLIAHGMFIPILFFPIFSRMFVVVQACANPYARKEGGTASRLVAEARTTHALVALVWILIPFALWGLDHMWYLGAMLAIGALGTLSVAVKGRRRIGGVTGDLLGATVEVAETCMLVVAAVLLGSSL